MGNYDQSDHKGEARLRALEPTFVTPPMRIATPLFLSPTALCAQPDQLERIKEVVFRIDTDTTLSVDTVEAATIYNVSLDGGGEVLYTYRGKELVKLSVGLGFSWGISTREYYFLNDTIILLREREELFPWNADSTGYDHTSLFMSYEATHYLWTWHIELEVKKQGSPGWAGPPDEAEINLVRLLRFKPR
jgi:hypothetical protein